MSKRKSKSPKRKSPKKSKSPEGKNFKRKSPSRKSSKGSSKGKRKLSPEEKQERKIKKEIKNELEHKIMNATIFNGEFVKNMSGNDNMKVTLEKNYKGYSLFATKPIKKGTIIAYYKFLVHKNDSSYKSKKNEMYSITVYTRRGSQHPYLIGDVYEGSLEQPKKGIPFWAYFSNEPSGDQEENAFLDENVKGNYRKRSRVKAGETMIYKLIAARDIEPGEEITWCYGSAYHRNYEANCS